MKNLFDLCCDYIESSHTNEGVMNADEKIYNCCVDYVNHSTSKYVESTLRTFFAKYL